MGLYRSIMPLNILEKNNFAQAKYLPRQCTHRYVKAYCNFFELLSAELS